MSKCCKVEIRCVAMAAIVFSKALMSKFRDDSIILVQIKCISKLVVYHCEICEEGEIVFLFFLKTFLFTTWLIKMLKYVRARE